MTGHAFLPWRITNALMIELNMNLHLLKIKTNNEKEGNKTKNISMAFPE
jgi:hypothetical protein